MSGTAGGNLSATQYNLDILPGTIIKRGNRPTNSTASASAQAVLRLDGITLIAGRSYEICTNSLLVFSSVAGDTGSARIWYDSTGASATTASTLHVIGNTYVATTANGGAQRLSGFLHPSSSATYSFLLGTARAAGTGNISLFGTSGEGISLFVIDRGVSVADTGVDL